MIMRRFFMVLALVAVLVAAPLKFVTASDGSFTAFMSLSGTSQTGESFSPTSNVSGSLAYGVKYAFDESHNFFARVGFRSMPIFGPEGDVEDKMKAILIGLEKHYALGFNDGFMKNTALVLLLSGSDQLNSPDDFDLVAGFGINKRLNLQAGAAVLSVMPFFTVTDVEGSNLIEFGFLLNVTPPK